MLFPLFAVVLIDIAVLAQASCVKFVVVAFPRLFAAPLSMVAVAAHSLGVVRPIIVSTLVNLLSL